MQEWNVNTINYIQTLDIKRRKTMPCPGPGRGAVSLSYLLRGWESICFLADDKIENSRPGKRKEDIYQIREHQQNFHAAAAIMMFATTKPFLISGFWCIFSVQPGAICWLLKWNICANITFFSSKSNHLFDFASSSLIQQFP